MVNVFPKDIMQLSGQDSNMALSTPDALTTRPERLHGRLQYIFYTQKLNITFPIKESYVNLKISGK